MDKSIRKLISVVLLSIMAICVKGQTGDIKISKKEIIGKAWKAMFGERSDTDIKSIYLEGYFHGSTEPSRMTIKRPNLFSNEIKPGILVFDGRRAAWVKREPDGDGNPQNPELIKEADWKHFEVDIALVFPAFFDYPAEFKGIERVKGYNQFLNLEQQSNVKA